MGRASSNRLDVLGDNNYWLRIRIPEELDRYIVHKGSIAIDGVSLTVAAIQESILSVTIIPHTYEMTALRVAGPASRESRVRCFRKVSGEDGFGLQSG